MELAPSELNLRYKSAFPALIPDAYECLLLDVIQGDRNLFIRSDELEAAWDIFTPVLHHLDKHRLIPEPYPAGGPSPGAGRDLARRYGIPES